MGCSLYLCSLQKKKHENCYLLVSKVFFWLISFCHKDDIYPFFFFFFLVGEGCWSRVFLFRINFRLEGLFNLIWLLFWVVVCVIKFSFFVHSFFWLLHFSNEVIFSLYNFSYLSKKEKRKKKG